MEKSSTGCEDLGKSLLAEPSELVFSSKESSSKSNLQNMFRGVFQVPTGKKASPEDRYQAMSDKAGNQKPQSKESCVIS